MVLGLRALLPRDIPIEEFPPTGASICDTVRQWYRARVAICPHGAGCTNMLFMRPTSTVVEVVHSEQHGRVYEGMARMMGHHFVSCIYNLTMARKRSQLKFARDHSYSSFVVDVPWLLTMLHQSGAFDALVKRQRLKAGV